MTSSMTPERWQRAQPLFEAALSLPPTERHAFLAAQLADDEALAAELRRMLSAHEETGPLDRLAAQVSAQALGTRDLSAADVVPAQIGVWRVESRIGRGGMGSVYLARRDDGHYTQRAAIKLLRRDVFDPDLRRRFLNERHILGRIEHPGIARILDGGVTDDGRPWFALEYVEGRRIDKWSADRRLGVRKRLALFQQVCDAVQYAHRHLVVHRDLKPANILVTEDGHAKLLDFGIARLLEHGGAADDADITTTGMLLLTPTYASPEQLRGDPVGTASDVFQLGILLFELLTERRPRRDHASVADLLERPSAVAPTSLRRAIDGDLDTIVAAATRTEPHRRYASAEHLKDDVQRWLQGRPILARKDTFGYRTSRFVRRNPVGSVLAGALAALVAAFLLVTSVQSRRLERERDRALEVAAFLTDLFRSSDPTLVGARTVTAREVIDRGADRVRAEIRDPTLRAQLLGVLASTYTELGEHERAVEHARESLDLLKQHRGDLLARAEIHGQIARVFREVQPDSAAWHGAFAIEILRRRAPRTIALANALTEQGQSLRVGGRSEAAAPLFEEALRIYDAQPELRPQLYAVALGSLSFILRERGEHERASELGRRALAARERLASPNTTRDHRENELESAERDWREAVATYTAQLGPDNTKTAEIRVSHARALQRLGRHEEARDVLEQAISTFERTWPDGNARLAGALRYQGRTLMALDLHHEAEPLLRRAHTMILSVAPGDASSVTTTSIALGECLSAQRRFAEAEPLYLSVFESLNRNRSADSASRVHLVRMIDFYEQWDRPRDAARFHTLLAADSTRS